MRSTLSGAIGLPGVGRVGLSVKPAGGTAAPAPAGAPAAWYDFSSTDYYTLSVADVTAAVDRSGNGNTLSVLAGMESPQIKTIAGRPGLDCNTAADPGLGKAGPITGLSSTTGVHVFVVYQRDEFEWIGSWENLASYNDAGWGKGWRIFNGKTAAAPLKADVDSYTTGELAPGTATNRPFTYGIFELRWDGAGTELKTRVDDGAYGTDASAPASTNYSSTQLVIGNSFGGGYSCEGVIGEVIIYNAPLSDADRDATLAYLQGKWQDTDEHFASVVLLLDWLGADAATDTEDLSDSDHQPTFDTNAQIDSAILSPEGTNTLLLDGGTDEVTFPDHADWNLGTGDFTVECSFQFSSQGTDTILSHSNSSDNGFMLLYNSGASELKWWADGGTQITRTWSPINGTAYHLAISRTSGSTRLFIDGVQQGATFTDTTDIDNTTGQLLVLGSLGGIAQRVAGSMGQVRITKGVGRYTENFDAPTSPYPIST